MVALGVRNGRKIHASRFPGFGKTANSQNCGTGLVFPILAPNFWDWESIVPNWN